MDNDIEFKQLLEKFLSKELTKDEQTVFESKLAADQKLANEFIQANRAHEVFRALGENQQKRYFSKPNQPVKKSYNLKRILYRAAASLIIPLTIGLTVYFTSNYQSLKAESVLSEVICDAGSEASVKLPDGSEVILHAKSKLIYPSKFKANSREVILEGEALFKVQSDKKNPFYVTNKNNSARIMAHGTEFRVINYDQEENIYVFLKHGKVDFISNQINEDVALRPGEELVFSKNKHTLIVEEATLKYTALEQGIYNYKQVPLEQLVTELNRRFTTQIIIENPNISNIKFTGNLKDETLTEIIDMITLSSPSIQCKKEPMRITLY